MNTKELKFKYKKLLNKAAKANGRKETVFLLNRAAKIKSKLYSNVRVNCSKCNGAGFLRISLDETKTCLSCYGRGFLIKEIQQF
ncbi:MULTISPECIES: molecular chaperone DnaJ [Prochlorococcus]|uniref:Putative DnaJ central domain (4 repeats) n=1 Tax=Prochlorococcus marinus str. MIT 9116 TaxID=167544 RepID=A0A0A1ZSH0_PROMR|nr:molecular chaperone DnaJ [Prochlorococcus marinus]KGF89766.1 putative DnaJ central domain (4 repeats) [Prochlorococcus marinus str. MIT 9107]KGF92385.1 putative DnaJ central domain (4 repeats) [Prochlorococcus marinus str. MIT 9116]KGF92703.1 putative DnaJ central domain (4 repeats) [Prochlorococcus marinus str. MIT 9123]